MDGRRATAGDPAAATPIAAPAIQASSIAHPGPDVRSGPNSFTMSITSPVGSTAVGAPVLEEVDHVLVRAHLLREALVLGVGIRFLRGHGVFVS